MRDSDYILREYRTTLAMIEMGEVAPDAGVDDARWLCREMGHQLAGGREISPALRDFFAQALIAIGEGAEPVEALHIARPRGRPRDAFRQRMAWLYYEARKTEGAEDPAAEAMREFRYADGMDAFRAAMDDVRKQHQAATPDSPSDASACAGADRLNAGYAEAIARLTAPRADRKGKK